MTASNLDFGAVWEDAEFDWELPIHNQIGERVYVTDFALSCACLRIEPRSFELAPGETTSLKLKINLLHARKRVDPKEWESKASHPFEVNIRRFRVANSGYQPATASSAMLGAGIAT